LTPPAQTTWLGERGGRQPGAGRRNVVKLIEVLRYPARRTSAVLRGTRARADLGCLLAHAECSLLREEMDEREERETWRW
jgi:hypothetical protein